MNVKNHHVYSDKLVLSVVDLSQIGLATQEDEDCGLAYWARLFKAKTWEELKMLAQENEFLEEAANSIYIANADEIVRQQCRAREEAERYERTVARDIKRMKEEIVQLTTDNAQLAIDNTQLATNVAQLTSDNTQLKSQLSDMESKMNQMASMIAELQKQLTKEKKAK